MILSKQIWNILSWKNTIWVKWVIANRLKERSFWEIDKSRQACWKWNHLLEWWLELVMGIILEYGLIIGQDMVPCVTNRNIFEANLPLQVKVAEMIQNGEWIWCANWKRRWPQLASPYCQK